MTAGGRGRPQRKDRFGRDIPVLVRGIVRTCTGCHTDVESIEIPAGYLDDPYWGPYLCGPCAALVRPA